MDTANVRYLVDDWPVAVDFYTKQLEFTVEFDAPAIAAVTRGSLRLLLSGPTSSGARAMPDGRRPEPGGWNRVQIVVDDLEREVARLRAAGVRFRNDIVTGPGGRQTLLEEAEGSEPMNVSELAPVPASRPRACAGTNRPAFCRRRRG